MHSVIFIALLHLLDHSIQFIIEIEIIIWSAYERKFLHCKYHVIYYSVTYSLMQSLFIFDIVFIIHHITFNISYSIIIINIYHHYSWDFSLYFIFDYYCSIFSIVFTLIHTWHFLYIDIWLLFSWSAYFDEAYITKFSTLMSVFRTWINCKKDFQILISKFVYKFLWFFLIIHVWFYHLWRVSNQFDFESCQVSFWWLLLTFYLHYTETSDSSYESHMTDETSLSYSSTFLSQSFILSSLIMQHNISAE